MITLSHIAYPTLSFMLVARVFSIKYSFWNLVVLAIFSNLPDFDYFYHKLIKRGKFDETFNHHEWFTHKPILYTPILFFVFIFPDNLNVFLACFGIFSHFVLDSFFVTEGIAWFWPFSKRYIHWFIDYFEGKSGLEWFRRYRKLPIYKLDIVSFFSVLAMVVFKFL